MTRVKFQMKKTTQYRWAQKHSHHIVPLVQFLANDRQFRRLMALILEDLRQRKNCNVSIPPSKLQFEDPASYSMFRTLVSNALSGLKSHEIGRFRGYVFQATIERLLQKAYRPPTWRSCAEAMLIVGNRVITYRPPGGRLMCTVDWVGTDKQRRVAVLTECKIYPNSFSPQIKFFIQGHLPSVLARYGWITRSEFYALGTSHAVVHYLMGGQAINVGLF